VSHSGRADRKDARVKMAGQIGISSVDDYPIGHQHLLLRKRLSPE
jgi:hypothetical protein